MIRHRKVNSMHVEDSDGVSIRVVGGDRADIYIFEYADGVRRLRFAAYTGTDEFMVDTTSVKGWEAPHGFEPVREAERGAIFRRIEDALRFLGFNPRIYTPDHCVAKRVDERTVIADRHFELLRLGGNVYIYRAAGKSLVIKVKLSRDPQGDETMPWIENSAMQSWSPPHEDERIRTEQQAIIHMHLQQGLAQFGYPAIVIELDNGKTIRMS